MIVNDTDVASFNLSERKHRILLRKYLEHLEYIFKEWNKWFLTCRDTNCSKIEGRGCGVGSFLPFIGLLQRRTYSYVINVIIDSVSWQHLFVVFELIQTAKETCLVSCEDHICILYLTFNPVLNFISARGSKTEMPNCFARALL